MNVPILNRLKIMFFCKCKVYKQTVIFNKTVIKLFAMFFFPYLSLKATVIINYVHAKWTVHYLEVYMQF